MEDEADQVELGEEKIEFLIRAIEDTQGSIQFADTKAGAIIGAWGLLLTVLSTYFSSWSVLLTGRSRVETGIALILAIYAILCLGRSIWLAFLTIAPNVSVRDSVQTDLPAEHRELFYLYSMTPSFTGQDLLWRSRVPRLAVSTAEYYRVFRALGIDDLLRSLVYELQCVSFIRNLKMARLNAALAALQQFLLVLLMYVALRSVFTLPSLNL